jgi:hypothetical protein
LGVIELALPRIISDISDVKIMSLLTGWIPDQLVQHASVGEVAPINQNKPKGR